MSNKLSRLEAETLHNTPSPDTSYKKVVKTTAVYGSSQVVQMIVLLLRTKLVAILLGPTGMGINSLILSAISIIQQVSSVGIFQSGVREMANLQNQPDPKPLAKFRKAFLRLTLYCGVFGTVLFLVLAPGFSYLSFENFGYTGWFALASLTLLFMALQNGRGTIMQATQNLGLMAKGTMAGAIIGLVIAATFYLTLGIYGIVPAIIMGYVSYYFTFKYYEKKIPFEPVDRPTKEEFKDTSKPVLKLGFVLMLSFMLMTLFIFFLNVFISNMGSVDDVGFYQSASSICTQGIIITNALLASDFFPRLSAIHTNFKEFRYTINQQAEIMLYIVTPISVLMIALAPLIVKVLLSSEFGIVVQLIQVMSISLIFRTIWIVLGYTILAKGDKKTYFTFDAILGNGLNFIFSIVAFYFWGLKGLSIAYVVGSIFVVALLAVIVKLKYGFTFERKLILQFLLFCTLILFSFIASWYFEGISYYLSLIFVMVITIVYCFLQINKKTQLIQALKNKFQK